MKEFNLMSKSELTKNILALTSDYGSFDDLMKNKKNILLSKLTHRHRIANPMNISEILIKIKEKN